ncbi:hypothetical protein H072_8809 [Dactylellina haptotyla CBS 200.50]|uniref:Uncharacterized protein n=1 Tax=Dactylellina haptotyla (strain CBS 200.50) TaxID=1284197 RepID=S8BQK3_DACHA|nr:hypothetical protein H072_8809 [Dactylellina haptotyla CBS 200.50]
MKEPSEPQNLSRNSLVPGNVSLMSTPSFPFLFEDLIQYTQPMTDNEPWESFNLDVNLLSPVETGLTTNSNDEELFNFIGLLEPSNTSKASSKNNSTTASSISNSKINLTFKLACPFAKSNPHKHRACKAISRSYLSGIKEHIKRNHFNKALPDHIRASRSWEEIFLALFPDRVADVPNPYFDEDDCHKLQDLAVYSEALSKGVPGEKVTSQVRPSRSRRRSVLTCGRQQNKRSNVSNPRSVTQQSLDLKAYHLNHRSGGRPGNHSFRSYEVRDGDPGPSYQTTLVKRRMLHIARRHEPSESEEAKGPKRFFFENISEIRQDFEEWMTTNFFDPEFSWACWELVNPHRNSRLSSVGELVEELEFTFLCYQTDRLALLLVRKADDIANLI